MSTIEEEINQKKFRNEIQKYIVNMLFTGNYITAKHKQFLDKFGISLQQFNVLRILRGQHPEPSTVAMINQRMLDKMSNVSRLVEKLRSKKLVLRQSSELDRRQVDIIISNEGLDLLKQIDHKMHGFETEFNNLSQEEGKKLNELLDKLRG